MSTVKFQIWYKVLEHTLLWPSDRTRISMRLCIHHDGIPYKWQKHEWGGLAVPWQETGLQSYKEMVSVGVYIESTRDITVCENGPQKYSWKAISSAAVMKEHAGHKHTTV